MNKESQRLNIKPGKLDIDVSVSELPHLIWDLCDMAFKTLSSNFEKSSDQYFQYLIKVIEATLGDKNALLDLLAQEGHIGLSTQQQRVLRQKVSGIHKRFALAGVDLIAVHFRSRRERSDSPRAWLRVVSGSLMQKLQLESKTLFSEWALKRHAFEKARENGTLFFHFDNKNGNELRSDIPTKTKNKYSRNVLTEFRVGRNEWEPIAVLLNDLLSQEGIKTILSDDVITVFNNMPPKQHKSFASHLERFCYDHLEEHFESNEERLAFIIESCVVTLTLLAQRKLQPPRSILLAPVFIGSERVGGVSFFSGNRNRLLKAVKDLKVFARNLLTYLAVREGHEVELEKRVLEEISPVTHLFIHTFNKAFTTPILNISDELDSISAQISKSVRSDESEHGLDRLHAIAVFMSSFSRRWGGTFPALQALAGSQAAKSGERRPKFLKATYTQLPEGAIVDHLSAVFAVTMSNDIFDDKDFGAYRDVLGGFDSLQRLVRVSVSIPHKVPGHQDIWCLHLLNLMQNSVEALPMRDCLWRWRDHPSYVSPEFEIVISSSKSSADNGEVVNIELRDNGCGFDESIRNHQNEILSEFARTDALPPSMWEVQRRIQKITANYSSKSGESCGSGLVSLADYLSRICRVRWRPDKQIVNDTEDLLMEGEVLERGMVSIEKPMNGCGAIVRLSVPVDNGYCNHGITEFRTGVFFEMRWTGRNQ